MIYKNDDNEHCCMVMDNNNDMNFKLREGAIKNHNDYSSTRNKISYKFEKLSFTKILDTLKPLVIILIIFNLLSQCACDIEPKPSYDDATTLGITKLHSNGDNGGVNDLNSINMNNNNNNNGGDYSNNNFNNESTKSSSTISDLGFLHAFIASLSVILVSELGDKTFFIAAIMAMRHPRLTVFTGAISALALMTILSAVFGMAATIIPRVYTYYISTALFAIFGLKMLKEGYYMSPNDGQEELEEVQSALRKREDELMKTLRENDTLEHNSSPSSIHLGNNNNDDDGNCDTSKSLRRTNRNRGRCGNNDIDDDNDTVGVIIENHINHHDINDDNNKMTDDDHNAPSCSNNHHSSNINPKSIYKTTSCSSTSSGLSLSDERSVTALNNHGTNNVIVHSNNSIARSKRIRNYMAATIKMKNRNSKSLNNNNNNNCDIHTNANGIELLQLNKKGECKNRLEREVSGTVVQDPESGVIRKTKQRSAAYLASRIFMQAFTMTFLAEWGDRSQLTTIILSAREDVYGVIVGGVLGHSMCTGLAVIGGRMIAQKISVRTVTLVGGVVFLLFAISALFFNPNEEKV